MSGAAGRAAGYVSRFSLEGVKKSWEIYPLFAIVGLHTAACVGVIYWMFNSRDIQVNRKRRPINERVDLLEPWPLKMAVIEYGPQPLPELHAIYQTMEEERLRRDKEAEETRKQSKKRSRKS